MSILLATRVGHVWSEHTAASLELGARQLSCCKVVTVGSPFGCRGRRPSSARTRATQRKTAALRLGVTLTVYVLRPKHATEPSESRIDPSAIPDCDSSVSDCPVSSRREATFPGGPTRSGCTHRTDPRLDADRGRRYRARLPQTSRGKAGLHLDWVPRLVQTGSDLPWRSGAIPMYASHTSPTQC
jgi:hypothetical protein